MKEKKTESRGESTRQQLLGLKKKTFWSWEKMCREFHRVMGQEGPSHTTLFRYALGKVKRRNVLTERYVRQAIQKVRVELIQQEQSETRRDQVDQEGRQAELGFRQLVENARDLIYRYRVGPPPRR